MIDFPPVNMLEWMWQMRWWGRLLVIATGCLTAIATVLIIVGWNIGALTAAVTIWAIFFVLSYLQCRSNLRKSLDAIISQGEHILAGLGGVPQQSLRSYDAGSEHLLDKYHRRIEGWDMSIERALKGTRYERQWMSNAGLNKPEDEAQAQGLDWYLVVWRNWISLRLKRLEDIRNGL